MKFEDCPQDLRMAGHPSVGALSKANGRLKRNSSLSLVPFPVKWNIIFHTHTHTLLLTHMKSFLHDSERSGEIRQTSKVCPEK